MNLFKNDIWDKVNNMQLFGHFDYILSQNSIFHSYEHLSENGKMIYDNLEKKKFVSRDY